MDLKLHDNSKVICLTCLYTRLDTETYFNTHGHSVKLVKCLVVLCFGGFIFWVSPAHLSSDSNKTH